MERKDKAKGKRNVGIAAIVVVAIIVEVGAWVFTLMGHIDDVSQRELREILGSGDVAITFELA